VGAGAGPVSALYDVVEGGSVVGAAVGEPGLRWRSEDWTGGWGAGRGDVVVGGSCAAWARGIFLTRLRALAWEKDTSMLTATSSFLEALQKWLDAVKAEDFAQAKHYAEHCRMSGELLAIHPDFVKCFSQHTDGVDPQEALSYLCQFLRCATEGRARVMGKTLQPR
jgi:hypothetical protein